MAGVKSTRVPVGSHVLPWRCHVSPETVARLTRMRDGMVLIGGDGTYNGLFLELLDDFEFIVSDRLRKAGFGGLSDLK